MATISTSTPLAGIVSRQVGLLCDPVRRERYADHYETPVGLLDVVDLNDADASALVLVVVDTTTLTSPELWSRIDVPALISPDLLASAGVAASLPSALDWAPLMPWPYSNDVVAATAMVSAGRIGSVAQGRLSTAIGEPPHPAWEIDEWWASSATEAIFGALLVGEALLGTDITSIRVLARGSASLCLLHTFEGGTSLIQTVAPMLSSGLPWLSAELLGDGGRLRLNDDFAPGSIALWDSDNVQFVFPAVPFPKPNVQAADSSRGGWDLIALFTAVLGGHQEARTGARAQAQRLAELLSHINL